MQLTVQCMCISIISLDLIKQIDNSISLSFLWVAQIVLTHEQIGCNRPSLLNMTLITPTLIDKS